METSKNNQKSSNRAPITPSTKFTKINNITPPPAIVSPTLPISGNGNEKIDGIFKGVEDDLNQKYQNRKSRTRQKEKRSPTKNLIKTNTSNSKGGKKSPKKSTLIAPEDVVQPYNTKRMEEFFQVLNSAIENDWTLNTRRWAIDKPSIIPPFVSNTNNTNNNSQAEQKEYHEFQPQSRAQLANNCLYFSQAVVSRANELDVNKHSLKRNKNGNPTDVVEQRILKTASMRLKQLEQRHKHYVNRIKSRRDKFESSIPAFKDHIEASLGSIKTKDCLYRRKLRVQADIASRRLQELLFECLGEISKACRRASILGRKLCENVDAEKAHSTLSTQWREFAMRLNEESDGACKFIPVEQFKFPKEFKAWENECLDVLASSKLIDPDKQSKLKMRRVLHLCGKKSKVGKDHRRRVTKLYQSRGGIRGLVTQMMSEYKVQRKGVVGNPNNDSKDEENKTNNAKTYIPLYPAPMPITSKTLQWVLPPTNSYPDARIYYCIEERLLKRFEIFTKDPTIQATYLAEQAKKATRPSSGGGNNNRTIAPDVLSRVADSLSRFLASSYVPGCREDPELSHEERSNGFHSGWKPPSWLVKVLKRLDKQANNKFKKGNSKRRANDLVCHVDSVEQSHRKQSHLSALDSVPSSSTMGASLQSGSESYEEAILTQQFMNALPDVLKVKFTDVQIDSINESGEGDEDEQEYERKQRFQAKRKAKANYYLHFAPASVIHVIETRAFSEVLRLLTPYERSKIESNYPKRTVLQNALSALYVLVDNQVSGGGSNDDEAFNRNKLPRTDAEARAKYGKNLSPFQNSTLIPLAAPAMKEMLGLYAARRVDTQTSIPDAVTVYREDESDLNFNHLKGTSGVDDVYNTRNQPLKLQYFVLHRPNTKGASVILNNSKYGDANESSSNSKANKLMTEKLVGYVENERHKAAINMSVGRNGARQNGVTLAQEKQRMRDAQEKQRLAEENSLPRPLAALIGVEIVDDEQYESKKITEEEGEIDNPSKSSAKRKSVKSAFVADIEHVSGTSVGGFCRWRGCISPGVKSVSASGKTKYMLCSLHQTLRQFLEGSGAKDELARHLPSSKSKKSSTSSSSKSGSKVAAEFSKITATSALLQELAGGKLAATIRAFCRRAAQDAKGQSGKGKGKRNDSGGNAAAVMEQLQRVESKRKELLKDVSMSQKVYGSEKSVAEELRKICALGVFPAEELAAIRDEYNILNRERVALQQRKALSKKLGKTGSSSSLSNSRRSSKSSKSSSSTVNYKRNKNSSSSKRNAQTKGTKNVGEDEDSDSSDSGDSNSDSDDEAFIGDGGKKKARSEGELELEFCKRKNAILVARRAQLERALATGKLEATKDIAIIEKSNQKKAGIAFDKEGYPLPKPSTNTGNDDSSSARSGMKITPRNRAEVRLQDAREFSSKTYSNSGKVGGRVGKKSSTYTSSRGPSPYLKQQKHSSSSNNNGKIRRSKSSN
eukprot:g4266.t1